MSGFRLFPALPTELRLEIWDRAISNLVVVAFQPFPDSAALNEGVHLPRASSQDGLL